MSGDQLDLDAIEALAEDFPRYGLTGSDRQLIDEDVPALVAEVRRLRALPDLTLGWDSRQGVLVFTDVDAAERVTLREWIERE